MMQILGDVILIGVGFGTGAIVSGYWVRFCNRHEVTSARRSADHWYHQWRGMNALLRKQRGEHSQGWTPPDPDAWKR